MTDYTKTTDFAAKDSLPSGDSNKVIRGTEFDTEFNNIATASATKADLSNPSFQGDVSVAGNISVSGTVDGRDVAADGTKLDTVETNADVTDTANVTAAGAVMDSELTDEAAVKALDQGVATTDSPTFAGATLGAVTYAATDGTDGQVLTTDGAGNATFEALPDSLYLNVKDFGATGDGSTDDTTAIQNAINHASNNEIQTIFFPDGHYKYTTLRLYHDAVDNPDFQGEEATYTGDNSTASFAYTWPIEKATDLRVKVDGVTQELTTDYTVSGVGSPSGGSVTFNTAPGTGLSISISESNRDGRFVFLGTGRMAISDIKFLKTEPNRIYGSVLESTSGGQGIIVEPTGTFSGTDARNFRGQSMTFIADNTGYIITSESCPGISFNNCSFKQYNTGGSGLKIRNAWFFTMDQCFIFGPSGDGEQASNTGDGITGATGFFAGLWNVSNCLIDSFSNGIRWTEGTFVNVSVKSTAIQNCNNHGFYADNGTIQQLLFDNVYQENTSVRGRSFIKGDGNGTQTAQIRNLRMTSSFMYGPYMTGPLVDLDSVDSIDCEHLYVYRPRQTFLNVTDTKNNQLSSGKLENCTFTTDQDVANYYVNYTATASQTVFAYRFKITNVNQIVVLQNGTKLEEGTDYTVSGVGNSTGGDITLTTGATSGDNIKIYSPSTAVTVSGSTTVFTGPYAQVATDLVVYVDDGTGSNYTLQTLTTDYTVSDLDNVDGQTSTVTFTTAPPSGRSIKIIRPITLLTGILPSANNITYPTFDKGFYFTADPDAATSRREFIRLYDITTGTKFLPSYVDIKGTTGISKFGFGDTKVVTVPEGTDTFTPSAGEREFTYTFDSPDSTSRIKVERKPSGGSFTETFDFTVDLTTKLVTLGTATAVDEEVKISTGSPYNITGTEGRTYYDLTHSIAGGLAVFISDTNEVNDGRLMVIKNNEASTSSSQFDYIQVYNNDDQSTVIARLSPGQAGLFVMDKQNGDKFRYAGRIFTDNLDLADNQKIELGRGTASGRDMEIYHDGTSGENRIDTLAGLTIDGITYPTADGSANQVLTTDGSGTLSFANVSGVGINAVVDDTTPQLGGDLDLNSHDITGTGNLDFTGTINTVLSVDGSTEDVFITGATPALEFVESDNTGSRMRMAWNTSSGFSPTMYQSLYGDTTSTYGSINIQTRASDGSGNQVVYAYDSINDRNWWGTRAAGDVAMQLQSNGTFNVRGGDVVFEDSSQVDKFYWDASTSRLGLGRTNPAEEIHIDASIPTIRLQDSDGTDQYANIYQSGGTTNIYTRNGTDYGDFYIRRYNGTDLDISFRVQNNGDIIFYGDDGSTQGVKFDASTNRLGIGTTLPSTTLDVAGTVTANDLTLSDTQPVLKLEDSDGTNQTLEVLTSAGASFLTARNGSSNGTINLRRTDGTTTKRTMQVQSSGDIAIYADDGTTKALYWDASTSRLGLGITNPAYELDVYSTIHIGNDGGSGFSHSRLILDSNGAGRGAGIFSHNQVNDTEWFFGNPYDTPDSFAINRQSTTTHADSTANKTNSLVTVNSSGNVGIGVVPETDWHSNYTALQVNTGGALASYASGTTFGTAISTNQRTTGDTFVNGNKYIANAAAQLYLQDNGGNHIWYNAASGTADATISWNERMRITSSGNLLVGKTGSAFGTAGTELQADGAVTITRSGSTGGTPFFVNRLANDGELAAFYKDTVHVGSIRSRSGLVSTIILDPRSDGSGLTGSTNGLLPVDENGSISDDGIDLGSSTARFRDIYAGNGTIQTSDRNEKQDIEELSEAEQRVAVACKGLLRKFRWKSAVEKKGDDARIHFGIIAQDLQDAFTAEGLDAGRYGMFINSTWTDEETGEERSRMGVRYSELLAFIISAI